MSNSENRTNGRTTPLVASAVMVGAGTLIALAGLAMGGGHLLSAARQRISQMEVPPRELARLRWTQARTAVAARAATWQNGVRHQPSPSMEGEAELQDAMHGTAAS